MTKPRKASAALAVGSLLAGAGATAIGLTGAAAAGAATLSVSKTFSYNCTLATGATPFDVTVSADVPDTVVAGQPIHLDNFQTTVVTPTSVVTVLNALQIASVVGDPQGNPPGGAKVTNEITDNGVLHESTFDATIPNTPVPTGAPLTTVASAIVPDYTTTAVGSVVLGSGPFTVTLHGLKADGSNAGWDSVLTFPCTPPSDATLATVTVVAPDATTLAVSGPTAINYGGTAKLSTVLKDTKTSKALSGAKVVLKRRADKSKPWTTVGTVTTSSTGVAGRSVSPNANTQFEWTYAGDATHKASTSSVKGVSVAQVPGIHSRSSVKHGVSFPIWGSVKPAGSGQKVTLQHLVGTTWRNSATVTLKRQKLPNGSTAIGYVFAVKEARKGTYKFRVHKAATSTLAQGTSSTVTVKAT